jgi:hypothetical protein
MGNVCIIIDTGTSCCPSHDQIEEGREVGGRENRENRDREARERE